MTDVVTAAILIIGDEILSGRTKEKNLGFIAEYLTRMGIDVLEGRIVPDDLDAIAAAINALRARYTYVFTSGGIGPTHDDVTADAVAMAFRVGISHNDEAKAMLMARHGQEGLNEARLRMARIPHGAILIRNPVSHAPGFRLENVHVMAGVPAIMQAMMDEVAPSLKGGIPLVSRTIPINAKEGDVASALAQLQKDHSGVLIGSYPFYEDGKFGTRIVLRSRDPEGLEAACTAVQDLAAKLSGRPAS